MSEQDRMAKLAKHDKINLDNPVWVLLYVMPEHDKKEPWKIAVFPGCRGYYTTEQEAVAAANLLKPSQYWVCRAYHRHFILEGV